MREKKLLTRVRVVVEAKMRDGQFWVLCPDNEVTEGMDRKRMMWTAEDAIQGRPPLSRWRE